MTFIGALFEPTDVILIRPVETWTDGNRTRRRVVFPEVCHPTADGLATDHRGFAELRGMAAHERANVFFGVCPRFGPGGRYDRAYQIRTVRCVWADLDHGCTPVDALDRCDRAGLPRPTALVNSGHGCHVYWRLAEPVPIDDVGDPPAILQECRRDADGKRHWREYIADPVTRSRDYNVDYEPGRLAARITGVIEAVQRRIGGDSTQDLARLLRLPCTWNRKDERTGRPKAKCELVECDPDRRYPLADFERFATARTTALVRAHGDTALCREDDVPEGNQGVTPPGVDGPGRWAQLVERLRVSPGRRPVRAGLRPGRLRRAPGYDPEAVWAQVAGIGKFADGGPAYFRRTWRIAQRRAESDRELLAGWDWDDSAAQRWRRPRRPPVPKVLS